MITLSIILLLSIINFTSAQFNPCLVDKHACVPFIDFDVGCTCILVDSIESYRNSTNDDVVMIMMGHAFPLRIFDQLVMPDVFREKLDYRIPPERDFEYAPELPETIYRSLEIEETMSLFVGNATLLDDFIVALTNHSMLRSRRVVDNIGKWCDEGECRVFVDEVSIYNRSAGVYEMVTDLLQVITMANRMVVAVSSVSGRFSIPLVQKRICQTTCENSPRPHIARCEQTCQQSSRYDTLALTGEYKSEFQMFLRAACIKNFRSKYRDFTTGKASLFPLPTRKPTTKRTTIRTTPTVARVAGRATTKPWPRGRKRPTTKPPTPPPTKAQAKDSRAGRRKGKGQRPF